MFSINYPSSKLLWAVSFICLLLDYSTGNVQALQPQPDSTTPPVNIATLTNGRYQFCSQPDPEDGRDGAGVCFNFTKTDDRVDGYYGYPHSDYFICVRGAVDGSLITGEALALSWAGDQWSSIPESESTWDQEEHLTLSQGNLIRTAGSDDHRTDWILFRQALLNVSEFYLYASPRMRPASELCVWQ